jgi:hypothetical protein
MGLGAFRIEVREDEIIVTEPGTSRVSAVFHMPANGSQLRAKVPVKGSIEFKIQAWWLANDRARELGWIP